MPNIFANRTCGTLLSGHRRTKYGKVVSEKARKLTALPILAILAGLALLTWSADRFVTGSAALAGHFGMSPLLIGMLIVGFGTSAPEMLVSALASWQGSSGIALGNAFGSNIANIGLILGLTALASPIVVHSMVVRRELPILIAITVLAIAVVSDGNLSRSDAIILLSSFALLVFWSIRQSLTGQADSLAVEIADEQASHPISVRNAALWTAIGLLLLLASSRLLVWGAVETATVLGASELIIGLTVVAVGTSLPELASSLAAVRRNEHDIALGNVIGSNMFNTLAVVGIAGIIAPAHIPAEILYRDLPVMAVLTLVLYVTCAGFGHQGRVNRYEGSGLLAAYAIYTIYLVKTLAH